MPNALTCIVFAIAAAAPLAACAREESPMKTGIAPPTRIPDVVAPAAPAGESVSTASVPRAVRRAVVADAAKRFKVDESGVVLTQAQKRTWSDASLGCPEAGRMYAQMLVEGFRITAKTSVGSLVYNTDGGGNIVSCGAARPGTKMAAPPVMDTEPKPYPPTPAPAEK